MIYGLVEHLFIVNGIFPVNTSSNADKVANFRPHQTEQTCHPKWPHRSISQRGRWWHTWAITGWPLVWIFNEFLCGFSFAPEKLKDRAGMRHHLEVYRNIKAINYIAIVLAWITRYGAVFRRMDGIGKWICINYMLACHTLQVMLIDYIVMITSYLKNVFELSLKFLHIYIYNSTILSPELE